VLPSEAERAPAAELEATALPQAPPHPCANRKCRGGLAPRGERYCPACKAEAEARERQADVERRGTASQRNYGAPWRLTRERILQRDNYLCLYCQNVDRLTEATIVDHVRPRSCGGTEDDANLASCCRDCHNEKTILHDGGYGRPVAPIDRVDQFVPTWRPARIA
jgi:5-methylcytosine-specific restriction protein A